MDSVLILCEKGPFGSNSSYEAIRLGSGFLGLGEDINCKILFYGEGVLTLKNGLVASSIGMDSMAEGIEMADLSELPIIVIKEDMDSFGMKAEDLYSFDEVPVQIISRKEIPQIMMDFDTVFHM